MKPRLVTILAAAVIIVMAPPLVAQTSTGREPSRGPVPTVTRLVKVFLEREGALSDAIRKADAPAVEKQLSDDFEMRVGTRAASPIPRDEFVREMMRTREPGGEIAGMAVHDLGTTAIVSFTQGNASAQLFVVDVWRQQGDDWKLAIRYASPAGSPKSAIPGAGNPAPEIPKKY